MHLDQKRNAAHMQKITIGVTQTGMIANIKKKRYFVLLFVMAQTYILIVSIYIFKIRS